MFPAAVLYLLFPAVIFLLGFSHWPTVVSGACGATLSIALLARNSGDESAFYGRDWLTILAISLLAVFLSGIAPPLGQNSDWQKHYALFNLLVDQPWPPKVQLDDGTYSLRYPLAWYVVPALVGKAIGKWSVSYASFVWTAAGLFVALRIAFRDAKSWKEQSSACAIFLLFSGADIVGYAITQYRFGPIFHIEWWAGFAESPANVTSLLWTPQHAIPAWIGAALFLRYPKRSVRNGMTIAAAIAAWSPFVLIGMAPVVIIALTKTGIKQALTIQNVGAAILLFIPIFWLLSQGATSLPMAAGWIDRYFTVPIFFLFLLLEFWILGACIVRANRSVAVPVVTCLVFLTALSLTRVGFYNDLMMRGGIPALSVLAVHSAETILGKSWRWTWPLAAFLIVGAVNPIGEIVRGFIEPRIKSNDTITIQQAAFNNPELFPQYLVKAN
ncbi:hypothetical protein PY650_34435 [Rhizobium calliandrae]|uniref:Uncharacterized protein n=1 Tax=Rhizobium calliandrae TaxID=1312182 RepID=A0ABT7KPS6_9HYPH|nr:hypothetical protein [Rhizobium calliandrae]MDL2410587.1 hypothetical protein [Rhizobium calliandrae]